MGSEESKKPVIVGLFGLGTVGAGVVQLLTGADSAARIARRAGRPVHWKWAVVRDLHKARLPLDEADLVAQGKLRTDGFAAINDPEVDIIVEVMGGIHPAREILLQALEAGKHVVTANKALIAECGDTIFSAARQNHCAVAFEASVGGGIPIIQTLSVALTANQIQRVAAILNGTCNFILTSMTEQGLPYHEALAEAQRLGYAEADPAMDVDGTDTAHKLAILAQVAFESNVNLGMIPRQGIDQLALADITYASELGYVIKLLAQAYWTPGGLALRVAPTLVKRGTPLAEVRGPYNAVRVYGDAVGDTLFCGRGAGALPTASAVVGDIIDVATGRALQTAQVQNYWSPNRETARVAAPEDVRSRYYLRFTIADRPGVLAQLARILGEHAISIASVIQHDPGEAAETSRSVPLVIMTHMSSEYQIDHALQEVDKLPDVYAPSIRLGVLDS